MRNADAVCLLLGRLERGLSPWLGTLDMYLTLVLLFDVVLSLFILHMAWPGCVYVRCSAGAFGLFCHAPARDWAVMLVDG